MKWYKPVRVDWYNSSITVSVPMVPGFKWSGDCNPLKGGCSEDSPALQKNEQSNREGNSLMWNIIEITWQVCGAVTVKWQAPSRAYRRWLNFNQKSLYLPPGIWSSPAVSGDRPSTCAGFTLTKLADYTAVMFGGKDGKTKKLRNDVYFLDLMKMVSVTFTGVDPEIFKAIVSLMM